MDIECYWNPHSGAGLIPHIHVRSGIGYPEPSTEAEQKATFCAQVNNRASDRAGILREILHTSDSHDVIPGEDERSQNDLSSSESWPEPRSDWIGAEPHTQNRQSSDYFVKSITSSVSWH